MRRETSSPAAYPGKSARVKQQPSRGPSNRRVDRSAPPPRCRTLAKSVRSGSAMPEHRPAR